jgi:hypothetical protein
MVFSYLDKSNNGSLSYSEFCNFCEEKRLDCDPFSENLNIKTLTSCNRDHNQLQGLIKFVKSKILERYDNIDDSFSYFDRNNVSINIMMISCRLVKLARVTLCMV